MATGGNGRQTATILVRHLWLLSNVLLNVTDQWAKRKIKLKHFGHYVDDHYIIHPDSGFLHSLEPELKETYHELINVNIHPNKIRYAPANSANQFLGAYVGPYYLMPRERTIKKFTRVAQEMEYELIFYPQITLTLETIRARVNSYCGIMSHYKSFELLRKYFYVPAYTHYYEFHNYMQKCDIKPEFCLEF